MELKSALYYSPHAFTSPFFQFAHRYSQHIPRFSPPGECGGKQTVEVVQQGDQTIRARILQINSETLNTLVDSHDEDDDAGCLCGEDKQERGIRPPCRPCLAGVAAGAAARICLNKT